MQHFPFWSLNNKSVLIIFSRDFLDIETIEQCKVQRSKKERRFMQKEKKGESKKKKKNYELRTSEIICSFIGGQPTK